MKKKLLALLMILILIFSFIGCDLDDVFSDLKKDTKKEEAVDDTKESESEEDSKEDSEESESEGPLLYKVTDDDGNVLWLFGSIHVGRDEFYPLPDYVMGAFEECDSLAVEFDIIAFESDYAAQSQMIQSFMYTDGSTITDYISEDLYNDAVEILKENNLYNPMYDYFIPMLWSSLIDNLTYEKAGIDSSLGIDRHLINLAKEKDMEVLDVESAKIQYDMFASFSDELQSFLLESSISSYNAPKTYKKSVDMLMDLWYSGNEKQLVTYLENSFESEEMTDEEKELNEEYNEKLLTIRNKNMTDFAVDAIESGEEIFFCVGAAHIVGDDGVKEQLKDLGYKVELVK